MMERSVSIIISFFSSSFWCVDHVAVYLNSSSFFCACVSICVVRRREVGLASRQISAKDNKNNNGKSICLTETKVHHHHLFSFHKRNGPCSVFIQSDLMIITETLVGSMKPNWNRRNGINEGGGERERKLRKREKGGNQWRHRIEKMLATVEVCTREGERRP